jgi:hypothetical protein
VCGAVAGHWSMPVVRRAEIHAACVLLFAWHQSPSVEVSCRPHAVLWHIPEAVMLLGPAGEPVLEPEMWTSQVMAAAQQAEAGGDAATAAAAAAAAAALAEAPSSNGSSSSNISRRCKRKKLQLA